jgi:putative ABC transport system permease protein
MTISVPPAKYGDFFKQNDFFDRLQERVESLPGVTGAGTVNVLPLQGGNTTRFIVDGDPVPPPGQEIEANIRVVNESYFQALGVPMVAGRAFDEHDGAAAGAAAAAAAATAANTTAANNGRNEANPANAAANNIPGVVIIGKTAADKIFAGRDPIGRKLIYPSIQGPPDVIVGVVSDVKIGGLDEAIRPVLYFPFRRFPGVATNLLVRTTADPTALASAIRSETRSLEPDVALFSVRPMAQVIGDSPAAFMRRFPALLIGIFATVALLLASIGIYGVVSYSVSQQTHYIGVRMALGAQTSDILRMVLKQGLGLALAGIAIGVVAALGLMRLLRSMLFEVQATDITTFAIVVVTLLIVALLACFIPARRATKVDPLVALRYE